MKLKISKVKDKDKKKIIYFIVGVIATLLIQFLIINLVLGYPLDPNPSNINFTNVINGASYIQGDLNIIHVVVTLTGPFGINKFSSFLFSNLFDKFDLECSA